MNEHLTEAVMLLLGSHSSKLSVEGLHLSLPLEHHVVGDSLAVVSVTVLRLSLDAWLKGLLHIVVTSVDVRELDLVIVILVVGSAAAEIDWLETKHHWDHNHNNGQKSKTDSVHLVVVFSNHWKHFVVWVSFMIITKAENLSNHNGNN